MTPEEIVEYIHEEHTPYSQMGFEEGKKHLVELINDYVESYMDEKRMTYRDMVD